MSECIFCAIANGEVPTDLVYEDDLVVAFRDLNPQAPVHVLVVPRSHYASIIDDVPAETLAAMARAVRVVSAKTGIDKTGFRVIINTGEAAGQTVRHLHWHLLGGTDLGEGLLPEG